MRFLSQSLMLDLMYHQKTVNMEANDIIDLLESEMQNYPIPECPLTHTLLEDQYIREIFMPAGSLITSQIHKTEHPYFILKGVVSVWTENDGEVILQAPHYGITKPGTRRVLYVHEDCVWCTIHKRLPNETVDDIGERIIEKHDNKLLDSDIKKAFARISRYGLDDIDKQEKN